ncbi:MAG: leucyl aminopeptidase, partial [Robiginitomaculum sp.]
ASKGGLKAAGKASGFTGKAGSSFTVLAPKGVDSSRVLVMGGGDMKTFDAEIFGAKAVKALLMSGETTVTLHLEGLGLSPDDAARAALGGVLASYRFDKYRTKLTKAQKPSVTSLKVAYDNPAKARASYKNFYGPVGEGTCMARDLVSEPPNMLFPKAYAKRIKAMEKLGMKVEILGEKRMKTLKMDALIGVGLGSEHESQMVIMTWNGGKKGAKPACLIGKGVTFDSGGISLKPGAGMWDMKGDMGGSAAVVGAMHTLAKRKAKANVIGIVGLVENMPDAKAQRPGDIVTSMSGQTIEVQNTDAEGRLVLCDVLHYARTKYKPAAMVNLATLTGAILVALGHEHGGCFSNNDAVANQLLAASEESTEKLWRFPLHKEYDKLLDSKNADMKNIGGRLAGSITAAQFLQRFVGDTPWAHLDIAGTAWNGSSNDPRQPAWATGFGARLLNRWIADNFEG